MWGIFTVSMAVRRDN
ncbi:hypothetical protein ACGLZU_004568 [Shigella flexneri]